jgi:hypothetical protein
LINKDGPRDEKPRREWLKSTHKLGTNSAWWLAERAWGKGSEDSDPAAYLAAAIGYVEAQYSEARAALRPVYDRLLMTLSAEAAELSSLWILIAESIRVDVACKCARLLKS